MFKILRDTSHNLLDIKIGGFLARSEAETYAADMRRTFATSGMTPGYRLLLDCAQCSLQSQEVLGIFAAHMLEFPKACRIAVIVTSPMVRMQIKRIMTQPYMATFDDRPCALSWVLERRPTTLAAQDATWNAHV